MENKDECCPKFNPKNWENKTHNWKNKPFLTESVGAFFHIPNVIAIGKKMRKMVNLLEKEKSKPPLKEWIVFFHDPSAFKSRIYLSCKRPIKDPSANNISFSGTFFSKVFKGNYKEVPKFIKLMNKYLEKRNKKAKDYYVHWAYCPKCTKKYGNNYGVLFAKLK